MFWRFNNVNFFDLTQFFHDLDHLKIWAIFEGFFVSHVCVQIYVKSDSDPINHYTRQSKEIV